MSISTEWIATNDIVNNPQRFIGKNILLGNNYSLVTTEWNTYIKDLVDNRIDTNFGFRIEEYICEGTTLHLLITAPSMESVELLKSKLLVDGHTIPDSGTYSYNTYMITAMLPDGTKIFFSQMLAI